MRNARLILALVFAAGGLLLFATAAMAQSTNARVTGTVSDGTGSLIPGVGITAENTQTGVVTDAVTNESGSYTFPTLQTGTYRISAELPGFRTQVYNDVALQISAQVRLDFTLQVADVAQTVEVIAAAESPLAQTTATVGAVLNVQRVSDLPISDRDVLNLTQTQAGVVGNSFSGQGSLATNTSRDGASINGTRREGVPIYTSVDLVDEVRVVTSPADVELSRGSGQIQLSTRSGTNEFHGSLFWSHRNTALNANDFFNNLNGTPKDFLIRNQFGGRLGGPIVQNKTFFHFLYDGQRQSSSSTRTATTLTAPARQGIFRFYPGVRNGNADANVPTVDAAGNPVQPASATGPLQSVSIFGLDPVRPAPDSTGLISDLLDKHVLPNDFRTGDGLNTAGIRYQRKQPNNRNQINIRVDQNFNQDQRLSVSYTRERDEGLYGGSNLPGVANGTSFNRNSLTSITHTSVLTPTMVNQVVVGLLDATQDSDLAYDKQAVSLNGVYEKFPPEQNFHQTFDPNGPVPVIMSLNTFTYPIGRQSPYSTQDTLWTIGDNLSISSGTHSFKLGTEVRTGNSNSTDSGGNGANVIPRIDLGDSGIAVTGVSSIPGIGNNSGLAEDLLLDLAGSVDQVQQLLNLNDSSSSDWATGFRRIRDIHQREFSAFFKDDWKVTPNLTLNLGVRYDWYGVPWEPNGVLSGLEGGSEGIWGISGTSWDVMWQPGVALGQLTEEIPIGKNSPNPDLQAYPDDFNNFGPGVGVSWSLPWFGQDKTVMRAGYSVQYPRPTNLSTVDTNLGAGTGTSLVVTDRSATYFDLSQVQVPLTTTAQPFDTVPLTDRTQTQRVFENNLASPYVQNWNLSLQRELSPGLTLEARYAASKGTKLIQGIDLNEANIFENGILDAFKVTQAGGDAPLFDQIFNGLVVNSSQGPVDGTTVTGSDALRANSGTRRYLANNDVGDLAMYLNTTIDFTGEAGGLLRNGGLPENFIVVNPQYEEAGLWGNTGSSIYHAGTIELTKQFSQGWQLNSSYTWSKTLGTGTNAGLDLRQNLRDLSREYARQGSDRTQVFKMNGTFALPFGPGSAFLSNSSGVLARIVEGWQVGAIMTVASGSPMSTSSGRASYNQGSADPVLLGALPKDFGEVKRESDGVVFFDGLTLVSDPGRAALDPSIAGSSTMRAVENSSGQVILVNSSPGELGNLHSGYLNGPSSMDLDMNAVKRITVSEGTTFEVRIDAINVLNHVNFSNPNTNINSSSFGRITNASDGRLIVGNLRLTF